MRAAPIFAATAAVLLEGPYRCTLVALVAVVTFLGFVRLMPDIPFEAQPLLPKDSARFCCG